MSGSGLIPQWNRKRSHSSNDLLASPRWPSACERLSAQEVRKKLRHPGHSFLPAFRSRSAIAFTAFR